MVSLKAIATREMLGQRYGGERFPIYWLDDPTKEMSLRDIF
jgi:hypothetical protein